MWPDNNNGSRRTPPASSHFNNRPPNSQTGNPVTRERANRRRFRQDRARERAEFLQRRLAESERQRIDAEAEIARLHQLINNERRYEMAQADRRNHLNPPPAPGLQWGSDEEDGFQQRRNNNGWEVGYIEPEWGDHWSTPSDDYENTPQDYDNENDPRGNQYHNPRVGGLQPPPRVDRYLRRMSTSSGSIMTRPGENEVASESPGNTYFGDRGTRRRGTPPDESPLHQPSTTSSYPPPLPQPLPPLQQPLSHTPVHPHQQPSPSPSSLSPSQRHPLSAQPSSLSRQRPSLQRPAPSSVAIPAQTHSSSSSSSTSINSPPRAASSTRSTSAASRMTSNPRQVTFVPLSGPNNETRAPRSFSEVHLGLPIKVYHTCAVRGAVSWSDPVQKEAIKGVEEIEIDPPSPVLYPHHFDPSQSSSSKDPPPPIYPLNPRRVNPVSHGIKHPSVVLSYVDPDDDCYPNCPGLIGEDCWPSRFATTLDKSLKQGEQIMEGGEKLGFVLNKVENYLKKEIKDLSESVNTLRFDFQCYTDESWGALRGLRNSQEEIIGTNGHFGRLGRLQYHVEGLDAKQMVIIDQLVALTRVVQEALNGGIGRGPPGSRNYRRRPSEVKSESSSSTSSASSHGRSNETRKGDTCKPHRKRRR